MNNNTIIKPMNIDWKNIDKINDGAFEVYKKCVEADPTLMDRLIEPMQWLFNQKTMRIAWIKYKTDIESNMGMYGTYMINNEFGRYMQYMYDSYPEADYNALYMAELFLNDEISENM